MSSVLLIGKETDTVRSIAQALAASDCHCERASGGATAIRRLRQQAFDVVIPDPENTIDEGLALIEEMRDIRPGMKAIVLADSSTPEEVIAALRARVFVSARRSTLTRLPASPAAPQPTPIGAPKSKFSPRSLTGFRFVPTAAYLPLNAW